MDKKYILGLLSVVTLTFFVFLGVAIADSSKKPEVKTKNMAAMVMSVENDKITVQDQDHIIYTFAIDGVHAEVGSNIEIEYTGSLNKNKNVQDSKIIAYKTSPVSVDENGISTDWLDHGIFSNYYKLASKKLQELSLDEKIAQMLLVRYPGANAVEALKKYQFGGYVFFEKDFSGKITEEVQGMMAELQDVSKIPILTATDEEGGKVVRVSSNTNLAPEKFKSSKELYASGGFDAIKQDTINKSKLLNDLGINLNLAPVVDVSTNSKDYMYDRAFGQGVDLTSTYARTVIESSKGLGVSYTMKHFPGYGNNADTHQGAAVDQRTYEEILKNDLPPFKAGIDVGAEAILVSHNTVNSIDASNPASLSPSVHNVLRSELGFTGIIMTDDLAMGAVSSIDDVTVKALLAGNDLIITTDYEESIASIKRALQNGTIDEKLIEKNAFRIIAWKYAKGLMFENQK
ncbi:MAG: beta-hexosaminidase [Bacilli bacterium]|nr:beta-hexosaminidase [Bacilli bacterium]